MKQDKRKTKKTRATINKICQTKNEKNQKQLLLLSKNHEIEGEKATNLKKPKHRIKKHITFEEYKKLIYTGKSQREIKEVTSKHLVYFYNSLLKGKITLTKDDFIEKYNSGLSLNEIARQENISREHITFLREMYSIKRKGAKYIHRKKYEKDLNKKNKDIIIASLLGDGSINKWGYFFESHSEKQIAYLEWKAKELRSIWANKPFSASKTIDKRSQQLIYSFRFRAKTHSFTKQLRKDFYPNGFKIIPNYIYKDLNELQLAIWFMDDGSTDWYFRGGNKTSNHKPSCKISSQSFSLLENSMLKQTLYDKWKINTTIGFRDKNHKLPYLSLNTQNTESFFEIVKPYMHPNLLYKIDKEEYLNYKKMQYDKEKSLSNFIKKHKLIKNQCGNRWS